MNVPKARVSKIANDKLYAICKNYYGAIPLIEIFDAARPVGEPIQEDGTPWQGFFCGREGRASIELQGSNRGLQIQWYKMPSGNFEVNAYIA